MTDDSNNVLADYEDPYGVYREALKAHRSRQRRSIKRRVIEFLDLRADKRSKSKLEIIDSMRKPLGKLESEVLQAYQCDLKASLLRSSVFIMLASLCLATCCTILVFNVSVSVRTGQITDLAKCFAVLTVLFIAVYAILIRIDRRKSLAKEAVESVLESRKNEVDDEIR